MQICLYHSKYFKKFYKKRKDQLELLSNQNVVYKTSCENYEANYMGHTKRILKTRLYEHISDFNKKQGLHQVIESLVIINNFNWKQVKILDNEHRIIKD